MRAANAIDFWRGVALVMIFINHVPGNALSYVTLRNFALVDAAELFVFLAGWSLFHATGGTARPEGWKRVWFRLVSRALEIYRMQIVISVMALAICGAAAILRNNPIYLEWNGAGPAFADPPRAMVGIVLLTFQVGYFNILPLYVVLLLMAPPFILLARRSPAAALALSLAIYVAVLWTRFIPPAWPAYERWYFNPFAWQVLMVMGYLAAARSGSPRFRESVRWMTAPSIVILLIGAWLTRNLIFPDPVSVPEPRMFFIFDKTYLTPARLLNFVALIIAFSSLFKHLQPLIGPVAEYMCSLGRNSLPVFAVASLLALVGQFIHFANEGSFLVDIGIVACGVGLMGLTAWFVEWRERLPPELSRSLPS